MFFPIRAPKILIVDENATDRDAIRGFLTEFGVSDILEYQSYKEVFQKIKDYQFDILVIDISTVSYEKENLFNYVKYYNEQAEGRIVIIGLMLNSTDSLKKICQKYGLNTILIKPVHSEELLDAIVDAWL